VRAAIHKVLGWQSELIEFHGSADSDLCSVEVNVRAERKLVFWVSGNNLINVPPFGRKRC